MPNALVPELAVRDWHASLRFYRDLLGFRADYLRPEEGFASLSFGDAELMIDQIGTGRDFGDAAELRNRTLGRGLNLQIRVPALDPLLAALAGSGTPLHLAPEERWYRRDDVEIGQRQFVVADPDGYLLRFCQDLGTRPRPAVSPPAAEPRRPS